MIFEMLSLIYSYEYDSLKTFHVDLLCLLCPVFSIQLIMCLFCLEIDEDRLPNQLYKVSEFVKVHFYPNNITPIEM